MKVKLTNMQIISELAPALSELKTMRTPGNVTIATVRTFGECEKAVKDYETARISILNNFCKKENGKPVIKDNQYQFDSPEDKASAEAEIRKIVETEVELDVHQVSSTVFEKVEISGNLYEVLVRYQFIDDKVVSKNIKDAQSFLKKVADEKEPEKEKEAEPVAN